MDITEIDVAAELSQFDWINATWSDTKLIAASPFRDDRHPSFFANLDRASPYYGKWADSGAVDDEYRSGDFVKLLAYLRQESEAETDEYLRMMYFDEPAEGAPSTLRPRSLASDKVARPTTLDPSILLPYRRYHPYLSGRGISAEVQQYMQLGYSATDRAVTIPWFDAGGRLAAIMYRSVVGKTFWYRKGGRPIRDLVYGANVLYEDNVREAVICEAPIDALTVMSAGHYAVAVGGTAFGSAKRDILIRSPLQSVIIMADHDEPGQALKRRIIRELSGHMTVKIAGYPIKYKDINEYAVNNSVEILPKFVERAKTVDLLPYKGLGVTKRSKFDNNRLVKRG